MKNLGLYSNYFGFVGLTLEKAKKAGLLGKGLNPMPREMSFPAQRGENWNDLYDFIRYRTYQIHSQHIKGASSNNKE